MYFLDDVIEHYLRVCLEEAAGAEILTLRMILETCSFSKAVCKSKSRHFVLFIYIDSFSLRLETEEWISDRSSAVECKVVGTVCVCVCLVDGQKITKLSLFFSHGLRLSRVSTEFLSLASSELAATARGPLRCLLPHPQSQPNSEPFYV